MRKVKVSDITMIQAANAREYSLSFKDRIDLAAQIDRLHVDVLELEGIRQLRTDSLRIKSIASTLKNAVAAVPVELSEENVRQVGETVKGLSRIRLQVKVPTSAVQMEYLLHKKPDKVMELASRIMEMCLEYTDDVEFVALDATRSERSFLSGIIAAAVEAGASAVTLCDDAGTMLPGEMEQFISDIFENVPALRNISLGVCCSDKLNMAAALSMAAVNAGASEVKAAAHPVDCPALSHIAKILETKGEECGVCCGIRTVEMKRVLERVNAICEAVHSKNSPFDDGVGAESVLIKERVELDADADREEVRRAVTSLGYDLSDEDMDSVMTAISSIASKKEKVGPAELDAIVTAQAMQVPATYELDTYVINIGNQITCMAHIRLKKNGTLCEGMALGDGPIDAAYLAIEQITGHHYVLDDFQIRAVTEGHEAMGETVVKLISGGKIYPGRGISTDIIGSAVLAYLNALNKITYEEA